MFQPILDSIPSYAKDIKLNFSSLLNSDKNSSEQQFWGIMLASAITCKNKMLMEAVNTTAQNYLSSEAISAAKTAAALMAMNNIYYRFTHLVSNTEYTKMPANLRMSAMAQPGVDKIDFELYALAVSAINGCGMCMDSHEKILVRKGVSKELIQAAIRIAASVHSVGVVLSAEQS
jgi:alkyl hydroperoxide reductase subunit D